MIVMLVRARCRCCAGRLTTRDKWPCGEEGREETETQHNVMKPLADTQLLTNVFVNSKHTRTHTLGFGFVQFTQCLSLLARVHKTSAPCCSYSLSLFGVGGTRDLLNVDQVAKDKKTSGSPACDKRLCLFFQRLASWCRSFVFLSFYELPVRSGVCLSPQAG